jgi:hypothetical protein
LLAADGEPGRPGGDRRRLRRWPRGGARNPAADHDVLLDLARADDVVHLELVAADDLVDVARTDDDHLARADDVIHVPRAYDIVHVARTDDVVHLDAGTTTTTSTLASSAACSANGLSVTASLQYNEPLLGGISVIVFNLNYSTALSIPGSGNASVSGSASRTSAVRSGLPRRTIVTRTPMASTTSSRSG